MSATKQNRASATSLSDPLQRAFNRGITGTCCYRLSELAADKQEENQRLGTLLHLSHLRYLQRAVEIMRYGDLLPLPFSGTGVDCYEQRFDLITL
uniref:Uncharacterized protein n=1 Tax=Knipowitschia caucasica TaxID=637954 RepID=A0AAV2LWU2_KNICA